MPLSSTFSAIEGQVSPLNPAVGETLARWVESVPPQAWIVLAVVALLGFVVGKLSGAKKVSAENVSSGQGNREFQWRHEKLVLLERQESERRSRRDALVKWILATLPTLEGKVKMSLSDLAEESREIRQCLGTDYSRFTLLRSRLEEIANGDLSRPEAVQTCLEMAASQLARLESARERMRHVGQVLIKLDESFEQSNPESMKKLTGELNGMKSMLSDGSGDWRVLSCEADRQIRGILSAGGEPEYTPLVDVLLVDGGDTESLVHEEEDSLRRKIDDLLGLLEENGDDPVVFPDPASDLRPSTGFVSAKGMNGHHDRVPPGAGGNARPLPDIPLPEEGSLVLFRSNNAELWGRDVYQGGNQRARAVKVIPDWAEWISIRRLDTGEAVFAPTELVSLSNAEVPGPVGFNGSHEKFYGARHLGMFSDSCPNEVETRFTYGGWGFGHRVSEMNESEEVLQASGWAGREISPETVFEVVIYAELPELSGKDEVLEFAKSNSGLSLGQS
ncbi:MAG: hypothetical protein P1U68_12525 [Verrucomicrobiales bacterium]|nr:hypothetical protein [Verrucomicrobiales bacterium]